jgi:hypothetical protein
MEVKGSEKMKSVVLAYEMIGSAFIMISINWGAYIQKG